MVGKIDDDEGGDDETILSIGISSYVVVYILDGSGCNLLKSIVNSQ